MRGDIQDVKHEIAVAIASVTFLAVLAAVDAEKGVTTPTPGPAQVFEAEKAVKSDMGFPVVEVIGIKTTYNPQAEQVKDAIHELQIVWTQVGDDELLITAQLERLMRATRDVFWPAEGPMTLPNANSGPVEFVREEYTELMRGIKHPFVKASGTTLHVRTMTV